MDNGTRLFILNLCASVFALLFFDGSVKAMLDLFDGYRLIMAFCALIVYLYLYLSTRTVLEIYQNWKYR